MLVVVEDGDVEVLLEPLLDLEAAGGGDVLQVDAPERRGDVLHRSDDLVDVLGVQADGPGVHAAELLEEHRLALHHGERRHWADVAQAQHRRAVGHHCDRVLLDGERPGRLGLPLDGETDPGHAWRVDAREVSSAGYRRLVVDLDLAAHVGEEDRVRDFANRDALETTNRVQDAAAVLVVSSVDGDVSHDVLAVRPNEVDSADVAAGLADGGGDEAQHAGLVGILGADGDAIRSGGDVSSGGIGTSGQREAPFQGSRWLHYSGWRHETKGRRRRWRSPWYDTLAVLQVSVC